MFVALLKNGETCSLLDDWTVEQLHVLRATQSFFCPVCLKRVQLKIGKKRMSHFAHETTCTIETERETIAHLQGKQQLYEWLINEKIEAEVEKYLPHIRQRPDVFVMREKKMYAVEYQCSIIPSSLFVKRTNAYINAHIVPIWLLHSSHVQRRGLFFQLSSFSWLFFNSYEMIPLYCPERREVWFLHHLIPLSATMAYGEWTTIPLDTMSFSSFQQTPQRQHDGLFHAWQMKKKQWRQSPSYYRTNRSFCRIVYNEHMTPSLFPHEAGIPLRHSYWLKTPPFIWQTYMLLEMMRIPPHMTFSFHQLYERMQHFIRQNLIHIRCLPLMTKSHYSYAFMDYLHALVSLQLLKKVGKSTFQRIRSWSLPRTIEEAMKGDQQVLERIVSKKEDFFTKRE
ncbi:competence protein CoiA [Anoxybacillus suryakundensis]|uniref:Competence protein CoiA-like family, contains a predicted nuclease domain n=1 Tax=Anoxybacillus suryakundensis TaxID=1325335 RepID=A0A0K6GLI6_9BACL|nr:competence protein CoiA family protein [Anoxybacillus suryakundensis]CUA79381.1 Competence protein CoiA-like family, contains a predicted nuclease domain [Anoxybacillus suryakundensis]